jgi:HPt (histidine-containing phosphotransfer) domain-containing protein
MGNPNQSADQSPQRSVDPLDAKICEALDRMWVSHRSQILERVSVLESAASAIAAKTLNEAEREAAQAAAHKLAGTLGMFNLNRGTDLARELDLAYSSESTLAAASDKHLASLTSELRTVIESRHPGNESPASGS